MRCPKQGSHLLHGFLADGGALALPPTQAAIGTAIVESNEKYESTKGYPFT